MEVLSPTASRSLPGLILTRIQNPACPSPHHRQPGDIERKNPDNSSLNSGSPPENGSFLHLFPDLLETSKSIPRALCGTTALCPAHVHPLFQAGEAVLRYTAAPSPACTANTARPGAVSKQGTVHEAVEPLIASAHAKKKSLPLPVPYMTHPSLAFLF